MTCVRLATSGLATQARAPFLTAAQALTEMPLSDTAQHSLPAQLTSFIGREDEINALAALLVAQPVGL